jgi:thiosulfate/3-mercaptopyruvate sulfurtransferase
VLTARPRPHVFADKSRVLDAISRGDVAIVSALDDDLHARGVYGRSGRIPTSRCVPYHSLLEPTTNRLAGTVTLRDAFEPELSAPQVITYCGGGVAASLAALALHVAGHDNVAIYDGSLFEWCADPSLPLDP